MLSTKNLKESKKTTNTFVQTYSIRYEESKINEV